MKGVVFAGAWMKIEKGEFTGLSVSSFNQIKGAQHGLAIGIMNFAEELHRVQLGLINIARNNPSGARVLPDNQRLSGLIDIRRLRQRPCVRQQFPELCIAQALPIGRAGENAPTAKRRIKEQSGIIRLGRIFPVEGPGDAPTTFVVDLPLDSRRVHEEASVLHRPSACTVLPIIHNHIRIARPRRFAFAPQRSFQRVSVARALRPQTLVPSNRQRIVPCMRRRNHRAATTTLGAASVSPKTSNASSTFPNGAAT